MAYPTFESVAIGEAVPVLMIDPISRSTLALFAGASGDHNPMHIDIDVARSAGMKDVFAHGMLGMAYVGRFLTNWVPQQSLREFSIRFSAITGVNEKIICRGTVVEKREVDGEKLVLLDIAATNEDGEMKLQGQSLIALP
jgi:acyl dehydratase